MELGGVEPPGIRARAEEISHGPESGSALENWARAEHEHLVAHYYDTVGNDLARLGMAIARVPLEAGVVWRLTLPRGGLVETWEPGTNGLSPPGEIMGLVGGILEGNPLVPESVVLRRPGGARLRAVLQEQLEALLAHDPGVRLAEDPENLHQHRVAGRRVRALVRATRAYVDPVWARSLNELLRGLGGVTGPARDLDVLLEHVRSELASVE
ncbi:MAG TPA: CHAD domain-containing protein, partial [Acidimicrobiales bacterium]|nr:CHAD domain-containing protein [Acidimicrobiales bacterium]